MFSDLDRYIPQIDACLPGFPRCVSLIPLRGQEGRAQTRGRCDKHVWPCARRGFGKVHTILQMSVFSQEMLKSSCDGVEQGKRS